MKCPVCGEEGAYVGFLEIECINRDCKHFSERQANEEYERRMDEMWDDTTPAHGFIQVDDYLGGQLLFVGELVSGFAIAEYYRTLYGLE